jgi:hypothetical protein
MLSTFQALLVAVLALLPGAFYTFTYERVVGSFGLTTSDRLVRFFAASATFHLLFAGVELLLYRDLIVTGDLRAGRVNPVWFEVGAVLYILIPAAAGNVVGYGKKRGWRWAVWLVGKAVEPRAWDYLWQPGVQAIVRLKLKSGYYLAGLYGRAENGRRSYAAGYPEEGDIYLSQMFVVDAETGEFARDEQGRPRPVDNASGLLVRWSEVEYLEVQEFGNAVSE